MIITRLSTLDKSSKRAAVILNLSSGCVQPRDLKLVSTATQLCDSLIAFVQSDYWLKRTTGIEPSLNTADRALLADSIKGVEYVYVFDKMDLGDYSDHYSVLVWPFDQDPPTWAKTVVYVRL